jgi:hypothetical protein
MEAEIKSSSLLRMLAAALLTALTLVTTACNGDDEQNYYINGTIDSTTYTKSGYLLPTVVGPLTQLIAADSLAIGRILVVVYAYRGENIRLISARTAKKKERRNYEK